MQETTLDQVTALCKAQGRAGAIFASFDGWRLPKSYGKTADEYRAARKAIALADRSHFGRLRITGADGLDLLNRLSTNRLIGMRPGEGASTVLTTNQGRIIDLLLVINRGDGLLVLTSPQTPARVAEWIDLYTFGEDIAVADVTEETALLSLIGPGAGELLGPEASALGLYGTAQVSLQGLQVPIIRTDAQGIAGYDLLTPASRAEEVWEALLQAGAAPVGENALEMLRVEQGVPRYGRELGEDFNPLEAGLTSSISFDKGCYIGQEVVLRLNTYKKVQRHLKGIVLEEGRPAPGARLEVDGKDVGFLTSVVESPLLGRTLALGYVRAAHAPAGQDIGVRSGEHLAPGKVLDLPVGRV
ncbi:MAG: folate-binding protein YgfZ [Dehalococcoidia bacterium]|nr:folate-binding protein YgfZ [Dehalococcoidia bacterium]